MTPSPDSGRTRSEGEHLSGRRIRAAASIKVPQEKEAHRLGMTALVLGAVYVLGIGIGAIAWLTDTILAYNFFRMCVLAAGWIPVSLWVWAESRKPEITRRRLIRVGCAYQFVLISILSISEWWGPGSEVGFRGISWSGVILVFFPIIVPTQPHVTLVWSLICASTGPLTAWIANLSGVPLPPIGSVALYYAQSFVCVFIGYGVAHAMLSNRRAIRSLLQLGSYELIKKIGAGGMGEVWEARHRLLARSAAVKLVRQPEGSGAQVDAISRTLPLRFKREAQITARLRSPHTVELYDYGVSDDDTPYFAMEFLEGLDLERLIKLFGPIPPARTIHILIQICWSLEEAHGLGLIHRDIKPANLFLAQLGTEVDHIKVLDFGLTGFSSVSPLPDAEVDSPGLTLAGKVQGTPAYMAPEVVLGQAADPRADLYALGLVAYWLMSGTVAFTGNNSTEVMIAQATQSPRPLSLVSEFKIPSRLEETVMTLLLKDPGNRPQSARELRAILSELAHEHPWTSDDAAAWWAEHNPLQAEPEPPVTNIAEAVTVHQG